MSIHKTQVGIHILVLFWTSISAIIL